MADDIALENSQNIEIVICFAVSSIFFENSGNRLTCWLLFIWSLSEALHMGITFAV